MSPTAKQLPRCPRCRRQARIITMGASSYVVVCSDDSCPAKPASSPSKERAVKEFEQPSTAWSTR